MPFDPPPVPAAAPPVAAPCVARSGGAESNRAVPAVSAAAAPTPVIPTATQEVTIIERPVGWLESCGSYLASVVVHLVIFLALALTLGSAPQMSSMFKEAPHFEAVIIDDSAPEFSQEPFDLTVPADVEPSFIDVSVTEPVAISSVPAEFHDAADEFEESGGGRSNPAPNDHTFGGLGANFSSTKAGVALRGEGGIGHGAGEGRWAGNDGDGSGFSGRGAGAREAMAGRYGGTKASERAVNAALNWLARHQSKDGSWSIDRFNRHCRNGFCGGQSQLQSDSAATAMGLLPFLAAGETHTNKCTYQDTVRRGIVWMLRNQDTTTGNLAGKTTHTMYSHGLATIALCEAYGMTKESRVGYAAQSAIDFICKSQGKQGGWRYIPGDFDADTSVVGWQLMALKSAQMAGLQVPPAAFEGVQSYLRTVASGQYGGRFAYRNGQEATPTMTSVGLLCRQYLGDGREAPALRDGTEYLMQNIPDVQRTRDIYYWYYATQVMHNMADDDWETWNRRMRRVLIETQVTGNSCPTGSWDPAKPVEDVWGERGGRLMMTSFSCLTLEVYYRYLPLYDLDARGAVGHGR
jgi:hypothetical protein